LAQYVCGYTKAFSKIELENTMSIRIPPAIDLKKLTAVLASSPRVELS
jgi:hypothetical protein